MLSKNIARGRIEAYKMSTFLFNFKIHSTPVEVFGATGGIMKRAVMQFVYDTGLINVNSNVFAKPAFIADAYLPKGTEVNFQTGKLISESNSFD
ncbi:MAG TPA: hypothetical protein VIM55_10005 [Mucilaginibacter sp.]